MRPSESIELAIAGHAEWVDTVARIPDLEFEQPSLLPGWSRARVIADLAHKTQSHLAPFEGAKANEVRPQWGEGQAAAERETEQWSQMSAPELREQLIESFDAIETAWATMPDPAWTRTGVSSAGERSMIEFVDRHLRDVFVHHADLGVGYAAADWPRRFVERELAKRLQDLPGRAASHDLLAWLLGRAPAPELSPW